MLPPKVVLEHSLKVGAVYYFLIEKISNLNHYFVVVGFDTESTEESLLLVSITSKIEKRRDFIKLRGISEDTLVILDKKDYSFLKVQSLIDCNSILVCPFTDIIKQIEEGTLKVCEPISLEHIEKILKGIDTSPLVENKYKKLLNLGVQKT